MVGEIAGAQAQVEAAKSSIAAAQQQVASIPPTTYAQALRQQPGVAGMLARQQQAQQIEQAKQQLSSQAQQVQGYEQELQSYLKTPEGIVSYAREQGIQPQVKTESKSYSIGGVLVPYEEKILSYQTPYGKYSYSENNLAQQIKELGASREIPTSVFDVSSIPQASVTSLPSPAKIATPTPVLDLSKVGGFPTGRGTTQLINPPGFVMPTVAPAIDLSKVGGFPTGRGTVQTTGPTGFVMPKLDTGVSYLGGTQIPTIPESIINLARTPVTGFPTGRGTVQNFVGPQGFVMPTILPVADTSYAQSVLSQVGPQLNVIQASMNLPYQTRGTQFIQPDVGNIRFVTPPRPLVEKVEPGIVPSPLTIATAYLSPLSQLYAPTTKTLVAEGTRGPVPGLPLQFLSPGYQFRVAQVGTKIQTYGKQYESIATLRNQLVEQVNNINNKLGGVVTNLGKLNEDYQSGKIKSYEDYKSQFDKGSEEYNKLNGDIQKITKDINKLESQKAYKEIASLGDITTLSKEMEGGTLNLPIITTKGVRNIEVPGAPFAKTFAAGTEAISFFTPLRYVVAPISIGKGIESLGRGEIAAGASQIGFGALSLATPLARGITRVSPTAVQILGSPEVKFLGKAAQFIVPPAVGTLTGLQEFKVSGSIPSAVGVGLGTTAGLVGGSLAEQTDIRAAQQREQIATRNEILKSAKTKEITITPTTKNRIFKVALGEGDLSGDITAKKITDTRVYGIKVNYEDPITGKTVNRDFAYLETGKLIGGPTDLEGRREFIGFEIKNGDIAQRIGKIQASSLESVKDSLTAISTNAVVTYNEPKGFIKTILGKEGKEISYSIKADEVINNKKQFTYANPNAEPVKVSIIKGDTVAKFEVPARSTASFDIGRVKITGIKEISPEDIASSLFPKGEQFSPERFASNMYQGGQYSVSKGARFYTPSKISINLNTETVKVIGTEIGKAASESQYFPGIVPFTRESTGGPAGGYKPISFTREVPTTYPTPKIPNVGEGIGGEPVVDIVGGYSPNYIGAQKLFPGAYTAVGRFMEEIPRVSTSSLGAISKGATAITAFTPTAILPTTAIGAGGLLTIGKTAITSIQPSSLFSPTRVSETQILSPRVTTVQREEQAQVPSQLPSQIPSQVPSQTTVPIQTQLPAVTQTQVQTVQQIIPTRAGIPGSPVPSPQIFIRLPPVIPTLEPTKKKIEKISRPRMPTGFEIQVRKRGKFIPLSPYSYPKGEAIAIGSREVLRTARATFRVIPSTKPLRITGAEVSASALATAFRPPKRPTGAIEFVQRRGMRISSPGEIRAISLAGAAARRTGVRRTTTRTKTRTPSGFNFRRLLKGGFR